MFEYFYLITLKYLNKINILINFKTNFYFIKHETLGLET